MSELHRFAFVHRQFATMFHLLTRAIFSGLTLNPVFGGMALTGKASDNMVIYRSPSYMCVVEVRGSILYLGRLVRTGGKQQALDNGGVAAFINDVAKAEKIYHSDLKVLQLDCLGEFLHGLYTGLGFTETMRAAWDSSEFVTGDEVRAGMYEAGFNDYRIGLALENLGRFASSEPVYYEFERKI